MRAYELWLLLWVYVRACMFASIECRARLVIQSAFEKGRSGGRVRLRACVRFARFRMCIQVKVQLE